MSVLLLLSKLKNEGVMLYREGEDLKLKSRAGKVTPEILGEIKSYKAELLDLLGTVEHGEEIRHSAPAADYPLSFQQKAIWMLSQDETHSIAYNMPLIAKVGEAVQTEILKQAVQDIAERHEAFRTSFFQRSDGEIRQRIGSPAFAIKEMDISGLEEAGIRELLRRESMRHIPLESAPLVRISILKKNERLSYIVMVIHHIIFDGRSLEILSRELFEAYKARKAGLQPDFGRLPVTYKDFAVWENERAQHNGWEKPLQYWKERLAGDLPVIDLAPRERPAIKTNAGERTVFYLPADLSASLENFCHQQRSSFYSGLLAALHILFYRYTGNTDLLTGTIAGGREQSQLEQIVGLFIRTIPLRTAVQPGHNFAAAVRHQHQVLMDAMAHGEIPFSYLVEELDKKRDAGRSPVFDILTIYNDKRNNTAETAASVKIEFVQEDLRSTSQFDLVCSFHVGNEAVAVHIEYNTDIYDRPFVNRLFDHYTRLLSALLRQPGVSVGELDYLSSAERYELLEGFNDTAVDYEPGQTLVSLFEQQAQDRKDATALVYQGVHYSYGLVDELSNQFAGYLRGRYGVDREALVCVQLPRSQWQVIVLLGILKAGCA
ncbi:MAG TPA: condensation domain-containing protein, partial [Chitinophaga sp.]|uniref:condensation domain-containing protein n=1 Tax=Chitinophaga sp. TaxID=1869181 RepID=UPI002DB91F8A